MRTGRRSTLLLIAAPVLVYLVLFVYPLLQSARTSLKSYSLMGGLGEDVTVDQYRDVLTDSYYRTVWLTTVELAAIAAAITTVLAALIGFGLWRAGGRLRSVLTAVIIAPLMTSGIVRAYGWIATTGPNGLMGWITTHLGLGNLTIAYSRTATIIGFVHMLLPYAVLMILASLDAIGASTMRAASNMGATPWQRARLVVLPRSYEGLAAAFLLAFTLATAIYSIPTILGGGKVYMIAQSIYDEQNLNLNWPQAAALAISLIVLTLVLMLVLGRVQATMRRKRVAVHV